MSGVFCVMIYDMRTDGGPIESTGKRHCLNLQKDGE